MVTSRVMPGDRGHSIIGSLRSRLQSQVTAGTKVGLVVVPETDAARQPDGP
jgi:hypothetical protein